MTTDTSFPCSPSLDTPVGQTDLRAGDFTEIAPAHRGPRPGASTSGDEVRAAPLAAPLPGAAAAGRRARAVALGRRSAPSPSRRSSRSRAGDILVRNVLVSALAMAPGVPPARAVPPPGLAAAAERLVAALGGRPLRPDGGADRAGGRGDDVRRGADDADRRGGHEPAGGVPGAVRPARGDHLFRSLDGVADPGGGHRPGGRPAGRAAEPLPGHRARRGGRQRAARRPPGARRAGRPAPAVPGARDRPDHRRLHRQP